MNDLEMFCNYNRIHYGGSGWDSGPYRGRGYRPRNDDRDYDYDYYDSRDQGRGGKGQGKGGKGQGKNQQPPGQGKDKWSKPVPPPKKDDARDARQSPAKAKKAPEPKPQKPQEKDVKKEKDQKPKEKAKPAEPKPQKAQEKPADKKATDAADAAAPVTALREGVYWQYGPFLPNSRAARRSKAKVKLGSRGLKKLTQLDGKKFEKHGPIYGSSLEVLADVFSFLTSVERWRLRMVCSAFALAFQLDPAWTSATLEPSIAFQGPWILRDHLPIQLDVMHKHKDVLTSLVIKGFDGLQGALLQNFTSLVTLVIQSSRGCTGLSYVPKSVKKLVLEFCQIKGESTAELDALKESHPEAEVILQKCVDEKGLEGPAEKGKPFLVSKRLSAGKVEDI